MYAQETKRGEFSNSKLPTEQAELLTRDQGTDHCGIGYSHNRCGVRAKAGRRAYALINHVCTLLLMRAFIF